MSEKPDNVEDRIAMYAARAGISADLLEVSRLVKMLAEMDAAGRQVRQGLERNDEPAIAFQPPAEKRR